MTRLLADELIAAANECPDRVWVRFMDGLTHTYGEFAALVKNIASNMVSFGVVPGDRVALVVDNRSEFLLSWFAAHLAGCVAVPLNTALKGEGLDLVLHESTPRMVIVEDRYLPALSPQLEALPAPPLVVVVGRRVAPALPFSALEQPTVSLDGNAAAVGVAKDKGRPCCIMYTSGTTGTSKGAGYCNGYHMKMGAVGRDNTRYGPEDTLYTCLPLVHECALNTSVTPALLARSGLAIGSRFSASRFWEEVAASGATATNLLGAMTTILLRRAPDVAERSHTVTRALVIRLRIDLAEGFTASLDFGDDVFGGGFPDERFGVGVPVFGPGRDRGGEVAHAGEGAAA